MRFAFFGDVVGGMRIAREEIFGPVLCVQEFADADAALRGANDSDFALAASVWTRDVAKAHAFARLLRPFGQRGKVVLEVVMLEARELFRAAHREL